MTVPFTQIDKLYIAGSWVAPGGGREAVVNPASEEIIAQAPIAGMDQVDAAIAAARDAFDNGPWPRLSMDERADMVPPWRGRCGHGRSGSPS